MAAEVRRSAPGDSGSSRPHRRVGWIMGLAIVGACRADVVPAGDGSSGGPTSGTTTAAPSTGDSAEGSATTGVSSGPSSSAGSSSATGTSTGLAGSTAGESTTGNNGTPPPAGRRWVLRDVDGVASDAVVEPTCRSMVSGCMLPDIGHTGDVSPQCVRVIWFEGQYLDLKYDTQTGRAEDCVASAPTPVFPGAYPTPDCAPPGYDSPGWGTEDEARWTRRVQVLDTGQVLYESRDAPRLDISPAYSWDGDPGNCVQNPLLQGVGLSPWLAIPGWAADALPSPPYTLCWE